MVSINRIYLLNHVWQYQQRKGYLSDDDVLKISQEFNLSPTDIESVITFYHFFKRKPSGKYTIYLNNSILSYFNGFEEIRVAFEKETNAKFGGVDSSGTFGLYETSCIGLSDKEPAALINFFPVINLTPKKVKIIIESLRLGHSPNEVSDHIEEHVRYKPQENKSILLRSFEIGSGLRELKDMNPSDVIQTLKESGLMGRGGAFFPTGIKWESCGKATDSIKYIVCNADEGEPGSFKDRGLMNLYPELMVEGMIIAAYTVGASEGVIYLRAEYFWLKDKIENTLHEYKRRGLLGKSIEYLKGLNFDIRVQMGAGAYICGEETSLLESLEGKRGEPRLKHFFPTEKGFLGKPTVVNNVETFCTVTRIIELGVGKFKALGTNKSKGTKLLCVAGDCNYPGLYEIEWGMKVKELLSICGATNTRFIQMSGPSGELISIDEQERCISLEDIRCEGSVMIFNTSRDLFSILINFSSFFTHESCGLCTPCRAGNPQLLKIIEKVMHGKSNSRDIEYMLNLAEVIKYNSRCGLGNTAPNSVINAINKFSDLIKERLSKEIQFNEDFDLNKATADYNRLTDGR